MSHPLHNFTSNPWIMAPMAGTSQRAYRDLVRQMGAGATPTELISAKGLVFGQARTLHFCDHSPSETPFWVQLYGDCPIILQNAAIKAQSLGAQALDINMGCPVKKITQKKAGSALLLYPEIAAQMVYNMHHATGLPISAKIRSGWDTQDPPKLLAFAKTLQSAGLSALSVHGRLQQQKFSGHANWEIIEYLAQNLSIPVIGNGDIFTYAQAKEKQKTSACKAFMIGRGALGNPFIFKQLADNNPHYMPSPKERAQCIEYHLMKNIEYHPKKEQAIFQFRKHLSYYCAPFKEKNEFYKKIMTINTLAPLRKEICDFFTTLDPNPEPFVAQQNFSHGVLG